jgi:hypothetical protein
MAKLAYKDMLKDDEIELFIRTYCTFHDGWRFERGKSPDPLWAEDSCWWLNTRDCGSIAALDLKAILKNILRIDRRVFHTWKNPAEMRIWFDLNKIAKMPEL